MRLYEIRMREWTCSYVRLYAWAEDREHALRLARQRLKDYGEKTEIGWTRELFCEGAAAFCTMPDGEGWEDPSLEDWQPVSGSGA